MASTHMAHIRRWIVQSPPVEWAIMQLRELLIGALKQGPVPNHVAFVMDGNRRFARSHRMETVEGHNLGFEALAKILEVCYKAGVKVVTIYAFSIENFKRSKYEVDALMSMAKVKLSQLAQHGDLLERYGACIRILGQQELLKPDVMEAMDRAVKLTQNNGNCVLNICVPYTSRDEMTTAIRNTVVDYSSPIPPPQQHRPFTEKHITNNIRSRHLFAAPSRRRAPSPISEVTSDAEESFNSQSSSTTLYPDSQPDILLKVDELSQPKPLQNIYPDPESITAKTLDDHMFTEGMPPLDLLVRTSGVERLSDFMLWQCHENTDIVFLECLWPEFDLWTFLPVLVEWQWLQKKRSEQEKIQMKGRKTKKSR